MHPCRILIFWPKLLRYLIEKYLCGVSAADDPEFSSFGMWDVQFSLLSAFEIEKYLAKCGLESNSYRCYHLFQPFKETVFEITLSVWVIPYSSLPVTRTCVSSWICSENSMVTCARYARSFSKCDSVRSGSRWVTCAVPQYSIWYTAHTFTLHCKRWISYTITHQTISTFEP